MLRDLSLVLATVIYLPMSLRMPAVGVLCWAWFSIMNPHRQVYGFAYGQPFNSVIAGATLLGFLVSKEPKRWPPDALPWLLLAFVAWMTLDTPFAAEPEYSWIFWDRTVRILALIFMVFFMMTTKARIQGMIWVLVISLGFYGVKGGVFTIRGGGHAIVWGPEESMYYDNNQLALAVVTELPLVYYLAQHTKAAWLRLPMLVAIMLQVVMVFGSYSRGGVLALGVMLSFLWLRSQRKMLYGAISLLAVAGGLNLMPETFFNRLNTMNSLNTDDSFQGRLNAWYVAYHYANDHFPFGAGFNGPQTAAVFHEYLPGEIAHAAHSIYFEVLGDHGWIGLTIYLLILVLPLRTAWIVRRQARGDPELRWAYDLADMIRVSLLSFYFGGAALSMAYADLYLVLIALLVNLRVLTQPATVAAQTKAAGTRLGGTRPRRLAGPAAAGARPMTQL